MSDIATRYDRLAAAFADRVAAVPADRWDAPSPCEGWTALDVVGHVVDSHGMFLGFIDRQLPAGPDATDDPVRAVDLARTTVSAALWDPATAETTYEGVFGVRTFAWGRLVPVLRPGRPRLGPRPRHGAGRHDPPGRAGPAAVRRRELGRGGPGAGGVRRPRRGRRRRRRAGPAAGVPRPPSLTRHPSGWRTPPVRRELARRVRATTGAPLHPPRRSPPCAAAPPDTC